MTPFGPETAWRPTFLNTALHYRDSAARSSTYVYKSTHVKVKQKTLGFLPQVGYAVPSSKEMQNQWFGEEGAALQIRPPSRWEWLIVGMIVAVLVLSALPALLTVHRVGSTDLEVQFKITDDTTGQPIASAQIEIHSEGGFYEEREKGDFLLVSGPDGGVSYMCRNSMCFGTSGLFKDSYAVHLPWWQFRVSAPGYNPAELTDLAVIDYRRLAKRDGSGRAKVVVSVTMHKMQAEPKATADGGE